MSPLARRAAGAVGDGHKRRLQVLQPRDGNEQLFPRSIGLRREELEAESRLVLAEYVLNVHDRFHPPARSASDGSPLPAGLVQNSDPRGRKKGLDRGRPSIMVTKRAAATVPVFLYKRPN